MEAALDGGDDRGGGGGGDRHPAAETNTLANLLRAPTECRRENHSNVVAPPPDINREIFIREVLFTSHKPWRNASPVATDRDHVHIFLIILFLLPVTQFVLLERFRFESPNLAVILISKRWPWPTLESKVFITFIVLSNQIRQFNCVEEHFHSITRISSRTQLLLSDAETGLKKTQITTNLWS